MKTILVLMILAIGSIAHSADGDRWCQWSGTEGFNCATERDGRVKISDGIYVSTNVAVNLHNHNFYLLTRTEPTVGVSQTKDAEVWEKVVDDITLTWTVRDLTTTEIDQLEASAMEVGQYYLWKALINKGVITQAEATAVLPQEVIDAYLARGRLNQ